VENRPRPGSSATEAVDCGKGTPIGKGSDLTVRDLMRGWRLVVVGSNGVTLEGLLCLNSKRSGFCL